MIRALLISLLLLLAVPAQAQAAQAETKAVSAAELERLAEKLEDPAARERLIGDLRALIAAERRGAAEAEPPTPGERLLEFLSAQVAQASQAMATVADTLMDVRKPLDWLGRQLADPARRAAFLDGAAKVAAAIVAGFIAEWLLLLAMRPVDARLAARLPASAVGRVASAGLRLLLDLVPVVAFAVAAYVAMAAVEPARPARLVALVLINANIGARLVGLIARALLSPRQAALRPLPVGDESAAYLYVWVRRIADTAIYGYFAAEATKLLGMPRSGYAVLLNLVGLAVAALLAVFILQNRAPVGVWIRGRDATTIAALRRWLAGVWHLLATGYVALLYLIWALGVPGGFEMIFRATLLTAAAFAVARAASLGSDRLLGRLFAIGPELRAAYPGLDQRANRYVVILGVAAKLVLYGLAALLSLAAWRVGSLAWLTTPGGLRVAGGVLSVGLASLAALAAWEVVNTLLERYLARIAGAGFEQARRAARLRTLAPLIQNIVLTLLAVFVGLILLSELGINIVPLLAGAGVLGIAVGLGAQSLAKDLITGFSNLVEDSFAVGDVVSLGGKSGVVEEISLRSLRLRDLEGTVHTIPFSEVTTVSNLTKEFSYSVLDMGVAYSTDIDRAMQVMRETAGEMRREAPFDGYILDDLEMLGVEAFADSAVVLRVRLKTLPGRQWPVMREFRRRIKIAFDRAGIEIPFPQRTIHMAAPPAAPAATPGGG
jgi:small conductance mechanosensitive channel